MSNTKNTGGPAFPNDYGLNFSEKQGMTLRDYFAAKAMQGMAAGPFWCENVQSKANYMTDLANEAYAMADAMLKAREQQTSTEQ